MIDVRENVKQRALFIEAVDAYKVRKKGKNFPPFVSQIFTFQKKKKIAMFLFGLIAFDFSLNFFFTNLGLFPRKVGTYDPPLLLLICP